MANEEHLRELEERYEGYTVYDNAGEKIGKVDDLFVDDTDHEEYIGVKMGLFGLSGTTLIPMDIVRVNERERAIEVSDSKDHVKDAPNFSDDDDITPEYEDRIRSHFGLGSLESSTERGSYGRRGGAAAGAGETSAGGDLGMEEDRERVGQESYRNREDMGDESALGSASASTAMTSGGMRDLETGSQGRVEDEGYREGYREGFREGYREGIREGGGESGEGLGSSGSMTGAGGSGRPEAGDLERGGREGAAGSMGSGASEARDLDLERGGGREGRREGEREGTGERREESEVAKVWRRIRG